MINETFDDWCFDLELFYESTESVLGKMMRNQLGRYRTFRYDYSYEFTHNLGTSELSEFSRD